MKTIKLLFSVLCCILLLNGCALKKPMVVKNAPIETFKYAYISPTNELTAGSGGTYGTGYGVYGAMTTKTVNPADLITGILMKEGFVILPELKPELAKETLIVTYGESGRRNLWGGVLGYTMEVTIQFLSAQTHEIICTCTAEGLGDTEADDIRKAISRALDGLFGEQK